MKSTGTATLLALALLTGCKSSPTTPAATTNYTQAAMQAGGTLNSDGSVTNLNGSITKPDGTVVPAPAQANNSAPPASSAATPAPRQEQRQEYRPESRQEYRPEPQQPRQDSPAPPAPIYTALTAPAGTDITIRTNEELSSNRNQQGDSFTATLENPIIVHGQTLYPAGTPITGQITATKNRGEFKGAGDLSLILTSIGHQHIATTEYDDIDKGRGKRTGAMIGGGAAAGAILGGIFGGGKGAAIGGAAGAGAGTAASTTGGKEVIIRPETVITFQLSEPLQARH